jgi:hypothetical protein
VVIGVFVLWCDVMDWWNDFRALLSPYSKHSSRRRALGRLSVHDQANDLNLIGW